jgi:dipeptidyl aminopeptidase/acylaminoacyl peptidase
MAPRYAAGSLVYADIQGQLFRQRFDLERLTPIGAPQEIAGPVQLDDGGSTAAFDVSRSGAIAYRVSSLGDTRLSLLDRAGRELRSSKGRGLWAPRFSPDGRRVAYGAFAPGNNYADVWIRDLAAGTTQRFTTDGNDNNDAQWSPDGRSIVYSAGAPDGKDLFVQSLDGGPARLLTRRPGTKWPSDWSRDGRAVLFTNEGADLWVQPADGGAPHPYLVTPSQDWGGRLSPDGHWVAYMSDETGQVEVYLQAYPTPGRKTLVSVGGGSEPVWRADGRELYYWTGDQLVAARLEVRAAGAPPVVVERTPLFRAAYQHGPHPNYDVSSDGTRFILVTTGESSGRLVVGLNLLEPGGTRHAEQR